MNKIQLKVTVDAEIKQMVEAAAAERKVSVDDYLLESVRHQLMNDGQLKAVEVDSEQSPIFSDETLRRLDTLHAAILERRGGEPIDIDAILELVRNERDAELLGLH